MWHPQPKKLYFSDDRSCAINARAANGRPARGCVGLHWCLLAICSVFPALGAKVIAAVRYQAPLTHRIEQTVNRDWVFNYLPAGNADGAGCETPGFNDAGWPAVAVPHTWQTYETTGEIHPFIHDASEKNDPYWWEGWGWYRKHFSIDKKMAGRKVFVEFDGVQKYSKIWINGKLAGDHKGGYSGFYFDITDFIIWGGDNVLAVAVSNRQNDTFQIPPMSAGNFDVYGGIYRDVRIVIKDRLHIPFQGSYRSEGGTFVSTPAVSAASGVARVRTWVRNDYAAPQECELRTTVVDAEGNTIQTFSEKKSIQPDELAEFDQTSRPIENPRLWSPEDPYLYRVLSDVFDQGVAVDHYESPLGFREFKWDYGQNRLILNGRKVLIHGSNRHQEYPWLGDATPKWLHLQDMRDFRENLNHNFMRTAHYPQDPVVYDYCDRSGIIVMEEVPNIKRQRFSPEIQEQQLREMIRRDRNHPSIFFWSMGNETDDAVDSRFAVEEDPTRIIHGRDIYNDSGGKFITHTQKQLALELLLRCTVRGWYNADVRDLEPENGQKTGTEEWQHDRAAAEIMRLNQGRTRDDGANISTFIYADHGADREYADCPLGFVNPKGWVDCWRTPKYIYYLWQAVFSEKPMVFIHPHFWRPQYIGRKMEIVVDSNCDTVELKANGRSLGTLTPRFAEANVIRFENVPVEPGVLTAEGRKGGQIVTEKLVMAGEPAQLTLSAIPGSIEAGLDSVVIVRADITDAQGNHVYGATNPLQWTVSGPARLVGPPVYASDIAQNGAPDGTMYIDAPAFNIIRSSGRPGRIKVRVQSPGLAPAEVVIKAVMAPEKTAGPVVEPPLPGGNRTPVAHQAGVDKKTGAYVREMKPAAEDLLIQGANLEEYTGRIDRILHAANPELEFHAPEYQAVVFVLADLLQKNHGRLDQDDFNFTVDTYNDCRCITSHLDGLKAPSLFKQSLREYYARTIITQGEAKDCIGEVRWLASLPAGQVVVAGEEAGAVRETGVIATDQTDLEAILTLVRPEFRTVSPGQKQKLLDALVRLNPQIQAGLLRVKARPADSGQPETPSAFGCSVPKGDPVLVPGLQELEQRSDK